MDATSSLSHVLTFASIPALAVVLGGLLASIRTPSPAVRSGVQHLAAGVLFAALATELLPDVIHRRMPWVTLVGFSLGVIAMLAVKAATGKLERRAGSESAAGSAIPMSLLLVSGVDITLDGLLIGISFAASSRQGLLVTFALTLEVLFLGVAAAAAISGPGSRRKVIATTCAFASLLVLGAALGAYFLTGVSGLILDAVMSFAVAALLYLVTEELLTEAHEVDETPLLTSMFFIGFVGLLTIEMLV
jgi:ZIP family zinc transporter